MRDTVLYTSMSLDGYLADENSGVNWLVGDGSDPQNPGSYEDFFKSIDTIILGNTTYEQITKELWPNNWVYSGKKTYVMTRDKSKIRKVNDEIEFTDLSPKDLIKKLRSENGGKIWLAGGSSLVNEFIKLDEVDLYSIPLYLLFWPVE